MIDAQTIRLEARLAAMEIFVAQTRAMIQWQMGITDEQAKVAYDQSVGSLVNNSVSGIPPELSDHWAAELHDAFKKLQDMSRAFRAQGPR